MDTHNFVQGPLKKRSPKELFGKQMWQTRYFIANDTSGCLEYHNKLGGSQLGSISFNMIKVRPHLWLRVYTRNWDAQRGSVRTTEHHIAHTTPHTQ